MTIRRFVSRPGAAFRLICFPYAGAGATVFRRWALGFPEDIEVLAVEYPGRGARSAEPPCSSVAQLVADVARCREPLFDRPFAVLGYSYGTLVAFEWLRMRQAQGAPRPICLFACARDAPHFPFAWPSLHELPDPAFIDRVQALFGGIPPAILQEPDLLALFLPVLRADVRALAAYRFRDGEPLSCPIHVFGGESDSTTSREGLTAWTAHTAATFALELVPGNHFFINTCDAQLGAAIVRTIRDAAPPQASMAP